MYFWFLNIYKFLWFLKNLGQNWFKGKAITFRNIFVLFHCRKCFLVVKIIHMDLYPPNVSFSWNCSNSNVISLQQQSSSDPIIKTKFMIYYTNIHIDAIDKISSLHPSCREYEYEIVWVRFEWEIRKKAQCWLKFSR